jgi:hypothetical protein
MAEEGLEQRSPQEHRRLTDEWEIYSRDTTADIDRWQLAEAWSAPAWRKLRMAAELSQLTRDLALSGLRRRHPDADEREIRCRFASLLFGSELASRLCGRVEEQNPDAI